LVDFFIKRPIFATVCALLIILAGAVSIPGLPISLYLRPGRPLRSPSPATTSARTRSGRVRRVTIPLEQQINGVEGMHYITSDQLERRTSNINVTFRTGYDLNIAAVDVQKPSGDAQGRLPQEIKNTGRDHSPRQSQLRFCRRILLADNSLSISTSPTTWTSTSRMP